MSNHPGRPRTDADNVARSALPVPVLVASYVRFSELVTANAVCLPRVANGDRVASTIILGLCDQFKMTRIEARPCSAEMVNLHVVWNWPDKQAVCVSVCEVLNTFMKGTTVPVRSRLAWPNPALIANGRHKCNACEDAPVCPPTAFTHELNIIAGATYA